MCLPIVFSSSSSSFQQLTIRATELSHFLHLVMCHPERPSTCSTRDSPTGHANPSLSLTISHFLPKNVPCATDPTSVVSGLYDASAPILLLVSSTLLSCTSSDVLLVNVVFNVCSFCLGMAGDSPQGHFARVSTPVCSVFRNSAFDNSVCDILLKVVKHPHRRSAWISSRLTEAAVPRMPPRLDGRVLSLRRLSGRYTFSSLRLRHLWTSSSQGTFRICLYASGPIPLIEHSSAADSRSNRTATAGEHNAIHR